MGLGINKHGALQGLALDLLNANENDSQLNRVCCFSLGGCGISFGVSCMGSLLPHYVSLPLSINRKAKADRGLLVSLRILQGLELIPLWSFPLSHLIINGLGFSFLLFLLDSLLLSSYPHVKELSTISTDRTKPGHFCLYWCIDALPWCMSFGLIFGV